MQLHPDVKHVTFLKWVRDKEEREIVEAYFIRKAGNECFSALSVALSLKKIALSDGEM